MDKRDFDFQRVLNADSKAQREKSTLEMFEDGIKRVDSLTESERAEIITSLMNLARNEFGLAQAAEIALKGYAETGTVDESELNMLEKLEFMLEYCLAEAMDPESVNSKQSEANWEAAGVHMSPAAYGEATMFAIRAAQLYPETAMRLRDKIVGSFEEKALSGDRTAILAMKSYAEATFDTDLASRIVISNVDDLLPKDQNEHHKSMREIEELLGIRGFVITSPGVRVFPEWSYIKP